jgi:hypothetical protein
VQATATLNTALKEWRTAESEVRNLKGQISNISDLVAAGETALVEGRMCGQQSCSNKPEGASTLSLCLDHKSPSINIKSFVTTFEQQEQCPIDSQVSAKWEYLVCPMNYSFYTCVGSSTAFSQVQKICFSQD